jgi:hypothetical protein
VTSKRSYDANQWILRGCSLGFHVILVILTYKFPKQLTNIHGPLLLMSYLANLTNLNPARITVNAVSTNVVGYVFHFCTGLLTNGYWIYTTVAIVITMVSTELYYALYLGIDFPGLLIQFFTISLLMIYASYRYELTSK